MMMVYYLSIPVLPGYVISICAHLYSCVVALCYVVFARLTDPHSRQSEVFLSGFNAQRGQTILSLSNGIFMLTSMLMFKFFQQYNIHLLIINGCLADNNRIDFFLSLFLTLSQAYSVYDEEIGYCQGQSFLAAVLLLHVS